MTADKTAMVGPAQRVHEEMPHVLHVHLRALAHYKYPFGVKEFPRLAVSALTVDKLLGYGVIESYIATSDRLVYRLTALGWHVIAWWDAYYSADKPYEEGSLAAELEPRLGEVMHEIEGGGLDGSKVYTDPYPFADEPSPAVAFRERSWPSIAKAAEDNLDRIVLRVIRAGGCLSGLHDVMCRSDLNKAGTAAIRDSVHRLCDRNLVQWDCTDSIYPVITNADREGIYREAAAAAEEDG